MKKVICIVLMSFICLFISSCDKEEEFTLSKLIEKSSSIENFYYEAEAIYDKGEQQGKSTAKIWVKGGKTKQELDMSGIKMEVLIDKDNNEYISYEESRKIANKTPLNDALLVSNNPFGLVESMKSEELDKYKELEEGSYNGEKCYVYESEVDANENFKQQGYDKLKYKIYIQKDIKMLVKFEIVANDKVITTIQRNNIKLDSVTDEDVKVEIPDDVKVSGS